MQSICDNKVVFIIKLILFLSYSTKVLLSLEELTLNHFSHINIFFTFYYSLNIPFPSKINMQLWHTHDLSYIQYQSSLFSHKYPRSCVIFMSYIFLFQWHPKHSAFKITTMNKGIWNSFWTNLLAFQPDFTVYISVLHFWIYYRK